jgi:hypothetical protein
MASPNWLGASSGYVGLSGAVNQLLGSHESVYLYSGGVLQSSATTGSAVYTSTDSLYLAQEFTTGADQTGISTVGLQISTVGGSPVSPAITPLVVTLYASQFGVPIGSALATATVLEETVYSSPFWVSVPLPVGGLTASTQYQLVVSAAGTSSSYYVWQQSNQLFGASTAPDDATWTGQSYGFMFQVYDDTGTTGNALVVTDDGGMRTVTFTYNANEQPATITEFTQTQNGVGITQTRTLTYSGYQLIGIA